MERLINAKDVSGDAVGKTLGVYSSRIQENTIEWILDQATGFLAGNSTGYALRGFFRELSFAHRFASVVDRIIANSMNRCWDPVVMAGFLALLPHEERVWQKVESLGDTIEAEYWKNFVPDFNDIHVHLPFVTENLLKADRPYAALQVNYFNDLKYSRTDQLLQGLAQLPNTAETVPGTIIDSYLLEEVLVHLVKSGELEDDVLVPLQFTYFSVLANANPIATAALMRRASTDPNFFVQLVSNTVPQGNHTPGVAEAKLQGDAETSHRILLKLNRMAGAMWKGVSNERALNSFVREALRLAAINECQNRAASILGTILARVAGRDRNDQGPPMHIADLLESENIDSLWSGFCGGILESEGAHFRDPMAGGNPERSTEQYYRILGRDWSESHPKLGKHFLSVADVYGSWAIREDQSTRLLQEGVF
ncbi:MAG: hypothetical protein KDK37_15935 [Leptospiraceae bacterium]|nr:hypothetical protein [Leptospiraceae bacterium]